MCALFPKQWNLSIANYPTLLLLRIARETKIDIQCAPAAAITIVRKRCLFNWKPFLFLHICHAERVGLARDA